MSVARCWFQRSCVWFWMMLWSVELALMFMPSTHITKAYLFGQPGSHWLLLLFSHLNKGNKICFTYLSYCVNTTFIITQLLHMLSPIKQCVTANELHTAVTVTVDPLSVQSVLPCVLALLVSWYLLGDYNRFMARTASLFAWLPFPGCVQLESVLKQYHWFLTPWGLEWLGSETLQTHSLQQGWQLIVSFISDLGFFVKFTVW